MIRRNQKCRDNADGLPGGVTIESFIDTHAGGCLIGPGEEASHVVTLANRTLLRFEVTVEAECDTDRLRYDNASKVWTQKVEVGHRPLSGGPRRRTLKGNLTCDDQASDEGIKMTIRYESIGCHCVGTATMQLLVDSAC